MASLTRWTWVSVNSRSWWWIGRPGMLRFMGLQRVGHDWATDLIWSDLMVFISKSILSDMSVATPAFFWSPFSWNIFFQAFTFSLYVSLGLSWVSCRQHIWGSCFYIHSASLCLLVASFNPFTFKVIIVKYDPVAITLLFWVQIYKPFLCFLSRDHPLAFVEELVWWCWILSAFACL